MVWVELPLLGHVRATTLASLGAGMTIYALLNRRRGILLAPLWGVLSLASYEAVIGSLYLLYWGWTLNGDVPVTNVDPVVIGYALMFTIAPLWLLLTTQTTMSKVLLVASGIATIVWVSTGFYANDARLVLSGRQEFNMLAEALNTTSKSLFIIALHMVRVHERKKLRAFSNYLGSRSARVKISLADVR